MENVHLGSLKQSENLARLSKRSFENWQSIKEQDNALKESLYKIRPGRKFVCDVILVLLFIGLVTIFYDIIVSN